jgi:peptidoglycan hydrolase-like protein with peptidoglycan-binding domain
MHLRKSARDKEKAMGALKNHSGMWLRDDAAAAINAMEDKYGIAPINSAGRTEGQQQVLINRWNQGGPANRPPYLYKPAMPAKTSPHVRDGGIAVDVRDYAKWRPRLAEFGYTWYGPGDVVHFNWTGNWAPASAAPIAVTRDRQNWLKSRGWNIVVDGIEGPATRQAYKEYQQALNARGLNAGTPDGVWGPQTQQAHERHAAEVVAAAQNAGSRPSSKHSGELTYTDIQAALNRHGYGLAVDGVWGPKSKAALADFQSRNGLTVDRLVGPATWDKLNR